jgi:hypothetical protein
MAAPSTSSLDDGHIVEPKLDDTQPPPSPVPASEKSQSSAEAFNPGWRFMLAFSSLAVITLMAALDATSISVALPVRPLPT